VYRSRPVPIVKLLSVSIVLFLFVFPLLTGCDFIDQLIAQITGGGTPGGSSTTAPTAVMTATVGADDALVNWGVNPDLRPPIWYDFNGVDSLDEYGESILSPVASYTELFWDFGDGATIDYSLSKSTKQHRYLLEGTYTASLTLRGASGSTDTAYQTITIGPGWLEIVSLTWEDRPDDKAVVSVTVRNQSRQTLVAIAVDLYIDGSRLMGDNLNAAFGAESTPVSLLPGATYTLTEWFNKWTGTLTARSAECTPLPIEQ